MDGQRVAKVFLSPSSWDRTFYKLLATKQENSIICQQLVVSIRGGRQLLLPSGALNNGERTKDGASRINDCFGCCVFPLHTGGKSDGTLTGTSCQPSTHSRGKRYIG